MAFNTKSFKILDLLPSTTSYDCQDGQGESGKSMKEINVCGEMACEWECTKVPECKGFDYPEEDDYCNCRLYPSNTPRTDRGGNQRRYCERLESKILILAHLLKISMQCLNKVIRIIFLKIFIY